VSSDIDLVMLYENDGETDGPRPLSYHEFYCKLTQRMMPLLSDPDADGYVFRTDLRLRPDGDGSPVAWSLPALERYFVEQGREWERYAWLKARVIDVPPLADSGTQTPARHALEALRLPFVYRKYFDFDALAALRGERCQQAALLQRGHAPAPYQLQQLHDEFDFADAALGASTPGLAAARRSQSSRMRARNSRSAASASKSKYLR